MNRIGVVQKPIAQVDVSAVRRQVILQRIMPVTVDEVRNIMMVEQLAGVKDQEFFVLAQELPDRLRILRIPRYA